MTADEPPVILAKPKFVAAAWAMWIFAAMFPIHIATVLLTAPAEKLTKATAPNVAAIVVANLCIACVFGWLAFRVRSGRSVGGACVALGVVGTLALAVFALVRFASKSGYQGAPALVAVQSAWGIAWLIAMTLALRGWAAR